MTDKNVKGTVSSIQRFSTGDGEGIRTTIFLKGCNLRCAWCHNPETLSHKSEMLYYEKVCTSCGACVKICETGAQILSDKNHHFERNKCIVCGKCVRYCHSGAMKLCGSEMTADEVFDVIKKDVEFYRNSGGGVTISGGEPLLQIDFCLEILKKCLGYEIKTIIDTAGSVNFSAFLEVIPYTDKFFYDIKCVQEDYKKYTGSNSDLVYNNLNELIRHGANVEVRIPVIPDINDSMEKINEIMCFLSEVKVKKVWLLPYHGLGEYKYKALGIADYFTSDKNSDIELFYTVLKSRGFDVRVEK